ncbi:MAG: S41 family peptidase [Candidatus Yanofskybacteria bacterium]|nr:S41 family peptidase [Candidatus Yanofskybacteria bacterium]
MLTGSAGRKLIVVAVILSLGAGFGGGFWFAKSQIADPSIPIIQKLTNQSNGQPQEVNFALFWEVWDSLSEKYVDTSKIDLQKMLYGAIEGMVNSVGDPYTVFFEPVVNKKFQEEISGAFGGVGIEIGKRNNTITVIAPLQDTPAFRAGILAEDKILKVDGKIISDMNVEEVVNLIRGKVGTKVILTISRNGESATRDFQLTRETIRIPSVKWQLLDGNIAYLQVYTFSQNVDPDFEKAANEILKSSATKLILDLRNNPGGLLDSAINLAGWFLDKNQTVTIEKFRSGMQEEFKSRGNGALRIYPTIVLINGGSASASEILAGALSDNKSIQLVGEKSFGKGSVQELQQYDGGSSLKVTIAKWLTPKGRSISDLGIEPNYKVEIPKDADPPAQAGEASFELGKPGKDPQLDKAIELLK